MAGDRNGVIRTPEKEAVAQPASGIIFADITPATTAQPDPASERGRRLTAIFRSVSVHHAKRRTGRWIG
jgi:hypothetical protein